MCGKPGTEARIYPTRTLKGVVFVWIGDDDVAPIEEDVPEEFFDDDALVMTGEVTWRCNWEVALENSMDSHVNYVHRNALVVMRTGFIARGAQGEHPIFVGNGFGGDVAESNYMRKSPRQDEYANGWKWPKTDRRRFWTWLLKPLAERARRNIPPPRSARWCGGHHLPGMFRTEFAWDLYTRMCVPVGEHETRVWYYHYLKPKTALGRLWQRVLYYGFHRWIIEYNFSRQDERVMLNQRYDTPEKLSGTDAEVIQWRRLVVAKHFGGRDAPFEYRNPNGWAPDEVPLERVSVRYMQERRRPHDQPEGDRDHGAETDVARPRQHLRPQRRALVPLVHGRLRPPHAGHHDASGDGQAARRLPRLRQGPRARHRAVRDRRGREGQEKGQVG